MKTLENKREKLVIELTELEVARLLDVLVEVTSQWNSLDTVALSPSYEEVLQLRRDLSKLLDHTPQS